MHFNVLFGHKFAPSPFFVYLIVVVVVVVFNFPNLLVLLPCFLTVDTMLKSIKLMPPNPEMGKEMDGWVGFMQWGWVWVMFY